MSQTENLDLEKKTVSLEKLMLDPNNPRFSKDPEREVPEERIGEENIQQTTLERMKENAYEIEDLKNSIRKAGFVNVDNMFVKKIPDSEKYVVVEGNRRLTAIKELEKEHEEGQTVDEDVRESYQEIEVVDLSNKEEDKIDFILGLRHHGSIQEWEPLPSAFNLFSTYMELYSEKKGVEEIPENFNYNVDVARKVAETYSVDLSDVRPQLWNYRVYHQLKQIVSDVSELKDKYSHIEETVSSTTVRQRFGFDKETCSFSGEGAEKFIELVIGEEGEEPVIRQASAGESNIRDYRWVLKNGDEGDIARIEEKGKKASNVKAEIKNKRQEKELRQSLVEVVETLNRLKLKERYEEEEIGAANLENIEKIRDRLDKILTLASEE